MDRLTSAFTIVPIWTLVALLLFALKLGDAAAQPPAHHLALEEIQELLHHDEIAEARSKAHALLLTTEASFGDKSIEVADVLDVLVETHLAVGPSPEAFELCHRAVRIRKKKQRRTEELIGSLANLTELYRRSHDYEKAKRFLKEASRIREQIYPADHPDLAIGLQQDAVLLTDMGLYKPALEKLERAVTILASDVGPDHARMARYYSNHGRALRLVGRFDEARARYEKALDIATATGQRRGLPYVLNGLGTLLQETGQLPDARARYDEALTLLRDSEHPPPELMSAVLNNVGLLLRDLGDFDGAKAHYLEALRIAKEHEGDGLAYATGLRNLAKLRDLRGDRGGALELYERARAMTEAAEKEHPEHATSLESLAAVLVDDGTDISRAESMVLKARRIWEDRLVPGHPDIAVNMGLHARILSKRNEDAVALSTCEQAVRLVDRFYGRNHPLYAQLTLQRATHAALLGKMNMATKLALQAEEIARDQLRKTIDTLPEREALLYDSIRDSGLHLALSLSTSPLSPRVYESVLRSRAPVLDAMAQRSVVVREAGNEPALEALRLASRRLSGLLVRGPGDQDTGEYRKLLNEARRERERAEERLARTSAAFQHARERSEAQLQDLRKALPPNGTLVSFIQYLRRDPSADIDASGTVWYAAVVMTKQSGDLELIDLGDAASLNALVRSWVQEVAIGASRRVGALPDYREVGTQLRQRVWDPIRLHLPDEGLVFLVPDGMLNLVNFYALPLGNLAYVVEDGPILHNLAAEVDLLLEPLAHPEGPLLAMGDIDFDARPVPEPAGLDESELQLRGTRCEEFDSHKFVPLKKSKEEISVVADLWTRHRPGTGAPLVLQGQGATESAFRQQAPSAGTFHLATHGFFLGEECFPTSAFVRGIGGLSNAVERPGRSIGLKLSGLVFAGANNRSAATGGDDGILTAEEILTLDLSGVHTAILSACDSGRGEIVSGEGVLGLQRAFRVAGVKSLVMTLWPVVDESALIWMRSYYRHHLAQDLHIAEAGRRATLFTLREMRRANTSHPFFWAPFITMGRWK